MTKSFASLKVTLLLGIPPYRRIGATEPYWYIPPYQLVSIFPALGPTTGRTNVPAGLLHGRRRCARLRALKYRRESWCRGLGLPEP